MLLYARAGFTNRRSYIIYNTAVSTHPATDIPISKPAGGYRFQKRKSKSESAENTQILFNASIRVYFWFLPSKDKWYLEDTKRANLSPWGSERGIFVCVLTTNDTTSGIGDRSVSLWEAAEDICGISVKGFVVKDINVPYRACEDTVKETRHSRRKQYIPLKKTRHWWNGRGIEVRELPTRRSGCVRITTRDGI